MATYVCRLRQLGGVPRRTVPCREADRQPGRCWKPVWAAGGVFHSWHDASRLLSPRTPRLSGSFYSFFLLTVSVLRVPCETDRRQQVYCKTDRRQLVYCKADRRQQVYCKTDRRQQVYCKTDRRQQVYCKTDRRQQVYCKTDRRQQVYCKTDRRQQVPVKRNETDDSRFIAR